MCRENFGCMRANGDTCTLCKFLQFHSCRLFFSFYSQPCSVLFLCRYPRGSKIFEPFSVYLSTTDQADPVISSPSPVPFNGCCCRSLSLLGYVSRDNFYCLVPFPSCNLGMRLLIAGAVNAISCLDWRTNTKKGTGTHLLFAQR